MSSPKPKQKLSFAETLVVLESAKKETQFSRWLDSDLERLEQEFPEFITIQSARRAAQATMAEIDKSR